MKKSKRFLIIWLLYSILFFVGCSAGRLFFAVCIARKKNSFPEALLYKGQPIHPCKVLATQFGDCTRFELSSIECEEDKYIHQLTYKYPSVHEIRTVRGERQLGDEYELLDYYEYVGNYQNKHIILGSSYDTRGTEFFEFLILLKREGNAIVNVGKIAAGDWGNGGHMRIISCDNNTLRYSQSATIDTIVRVLINESIGILFSTENSGISLVYEVNLNASMEYFQYPSQVIGLLFHLGGYNRDDYPDFWDEGTLQHTREQIERYFYNIADKYVKKGKGELNLEEAKIFAQEALQCIQKIWI